MPLTAKLATRIGRSPILPYYRPLNGTAASAVPEQRGLTLIGDPDRANVAPCQMRAAERTVDRGKRTLPQVLRFVFDPARPRKMLRELYGVPTQGEAVEAQDQRRSAGGALIERQNVFGLHPKEGNRRAALLRRACALKMAGPSKTAGAMAEHPANMGGGEPIPPFPPGWWCVGMWWSGRCDVRRQVRRPTE